MAAPGRSNELAVRTTPIPGLLVVDLPVHGDARGWFKENWQREKMVALGLPDFTPVQNVSARTTDASPAPRYRPMMAWAAMAMASRANARNIHSEFTT